MWHNALETGLPERRVLMQHTALHLGIVEDTLAFRAGPDAEFMGRGYLMKQN